MRGRAWTYPGRNESLVARSTRLDSGAARPGRGSTGGVCLWANVQTAIPFRAMFHNAMRLRPSIPRKQTLVMRFTAAKRRLAMQTGDVAKLANARIGTATVELNQITDDIGGHKVHRKSRQPFTNSPGRLFSRQSIP